MSLKNEKKKFPISSRKLKNISINIYSVYK